MVAGIAGIEAFRELNVLLGSCWYPLPLQPENQRSNTTHHNTSDSLKASVVAPFAYMITAPGARRKVRSPSPTTALKSSTSTRQGVTWLRRFFCLYPLLYIYYFHVIQKIKIITLFLNVWERTSFCPELSWRPCRRNNWFCRSCLNHNSWRNSPNFSNNAMFLQNFVGN